MQVEGDLASAMEKRISKQKEAENRGEELFYGSKPGKRRGSMEVAGDARSASPSTVSTPPRDVKNHLKQIKARMENIGLDTSVASSEESYCFSPPFARTPGETGGAELPKREFSFREFRHLQYFQCLLGCTSSFECRF
eukprot:516696-Rhodomonas_salina.1